MIKIVESTVIFEGQVELNWKDANQVRKNEAQNQDHTQNLVCWPPANMI